MNKFFISLALIICCISSAYAYFDADGITHYITNRGILEYSFSSDEVYQSYIQCTVTVIATNVLDKDSSVNLTLTEDNFDPTVNSGGTWVPDPYAINGWIEKPIPRALKDKKKPLIMHFLFNPTATDPNPYIGVKCFTY